MTEVMYGQCKCGASLTVDHLQNHCPLRPQKPMSIEDTDALEELVASVWPNPRRGEGFAYQHWMRGRTPHPVEGSLAIWPVSLRLWNMRQRRRIG